MEKCKKVTNVLVTGLGKHRSGVETVFLNYYRKINKEKIHFDFLICDDYIPFEREFKKKGSSVYYVPSISLSRRKYNILLENFFKKKAYKYDLIWLNLQDLTDLRILKLAKKYHIKRRIVHSHNSKSEYIGIKKIYKNFIHYFNRSMIVYKATELWACSVPAAKYFYPRKYLNDVHIINNAIDINKNKFNKQKRKEIRDKYKLNGSVVIGSVARLHMQKNQSFMLDILAHLVNERTDVRLVLVGEGPNKEKLIEKVKKLNLQNYVIFTGLQTDIQAYMSSFDIFLFPSLFEGLSVAALEAQANGVPFLASSNGNVKDIKINSNFKFIDLNKGAKYWANIILDMMKKEKRINSKIIKSNFSKTNFDINIEAQELEQDLGC